MRKIFLILTLLFLLAGSAEAKSDFGNFGTGTEVDDTCRLCFSTFDTLGHSADPLGDSIYILRFRRGALLDSTDATKLRNHLWCVTKKAYDGSNLGQYVVYGAWRPCAGKWYSDDGYYVVEPETVSYARGDTNQFDFGSDGVTVTTNNDKTGYSLTQSFPTNFADLSITATTGLVDITQTAADKVWNSGTRALTDYESFWNIAFSTGFTAGSMGDSLNNASYVQGSASGLTAMDFWNVSFSVAFDAGSMGDSLNNASYVQGSASGLTAEDIWTYSSRTLTDYLSFWNIPFSTGFDAGSMGDSLNNVTYIRANGFATSSDLETLQSFFGADSGWYQILYPNNGSVNKDSIRIFDDQSNHKGTIVFKHSNIDAVYDSTFFYRY